MHRLPLECTIDRFCYSCCCLHHLCVTGRLVSPLARNIHCKHSYRHPGDRSLDHTNRQKRSPNDRHADIDASPPHAFFTSSLPLFLFRTNSHLFYCDICTYSAERSGKRWPRSEGRRGGERERESHRNIEWSLCVKRTSSRDYFFNEWSASTKTFSCQMNYLCHKNLPPFRLLLTQFTSFLSTTSHAECLTNNFAVDEQISVSAVVYCTTFTHKLYSHTCEHKACLRTLIHSNAH